MDSAQALTPRQKLDLWGQRLVTWGLPAYLIWIATRPQARQAAWMEKYGFAAEQLWAEPYRAWTAAFLHLTPTHAVLNAAVWLMFCLFAKRAGVFSGVVAVLMIAWPASNALMVLLPDHQTMRVVGLSGVLYAFWAALSVVGLSQARLRALSLASLAVLIFKIWADQPWLNPVATSALWSFPVVQAVHVNGALAGSLVAFFAGFLSRLLAPAPPWPAKPQKAQKPQEAQAPQEALTATVEAVAPQAAASAAAAQALDLNLDELAPAAEPPRKRWWQRAAPGAASSGGGLVSKLKFWQRRRSAEPVESAAPASS